MSGFLRGLSAGANVLDKGQRMYYRYKGQNQKRKRGGRYYQSSLAVRNAKKIKRLERQKEFKFIDIAYADVVTTTGVFTRLTPIPEGTKEQERDGEKVTMRSLSVKLRLVQSDVSASGQNVRIIMFRDNYGRTVPTLNTVSTTDLITSGGTAIIQHFNQDNRSRYQVLFDKTYDFPEPIQSYNGTIPVFSGQPIISDKYYKKLTREIHYDGHLATALGSGQIWLLIYGTIASEVTVYFDSRIYFTDM